MESQIDNSVIQAVCKQLEDNGFKPNGIMMLYKDLPDDFKSKDNLFKDEDPITLIMKDGKPFISLYTQ